VREENYVSARELSEKIMKIDLLSSILTANKATYKAYFELTALAYFRCG
jgi:hypothetical protein